MSGSGDPDPSLSQEPYLPPPGRGSSLLQAAAPGAWVFQRKALTTWRITADPSRTQTHGPRAAVRVRAPRNFPGCLPMPIT